MTPHDDLLERGSVKVIEQRTESGTIVRTLVLLDKDGRREGGIAFAPTDPLYDLPLWIERLSNTAAEIARLRKIEQAADGLAKAARTDPASLQRALATYQAAKEGRAE